MAQLDIIARLQLNAEQFSSEAGKAASNVVGTMTKAAAEIRQPFVSSFAEVNKLAQTAITLPRTTGGSLDLSAEIVQLRQSAAASDQNAIALRELSAAQMAAATAGKGNAEALRLEADASKVAALAAEQEAVASRDRIATLEAVQGELNRTSSATRESVEAGKEVVTNAGLQKFAMRDLGYQLQDIGTQFATGAPLMQIFAQQGGQVFSALALLADSAGGASKAVAQTGAATGEAGTDVDAFGEKVTGLAEKAKDGEGKFAKFAGFMAGPWGAALTIGVTVLAPFVAKLFEADQKAEELAKSLAAAATAADSFGAAQSLLGRIIDLQTGKMKTQNEVLIQTIKLQAQANILAAQSAQKKAAEKLGGVADPTFLERAAGGLASVGAAGGASTAGADAANRLAGSLAPLKQVVQDYINLTNIPNASQGALDKGLDATLRRIDALSKAGKLVGRDALEAKQQVVALGTTLGDQTANQKVLDALNGNGIDPRLVPYQKDKKPKKPAKDPKTPDLTRESESAAETIARINAEWDDQPKLIDKARTETLKLDNLIADLGRRKPPGFAQLITDAQAAKIHIQEGLDKPFKEYVKGQRESVSVQQLQLQGRDAEASALQTALKLAEQQGPLDEAHLSVILKTAEQQERIGRALEDQRQILGIYTSSISAIRSTLDGVVGDLQDGKLGAGIKGLFGGLVADFKSLQRNLISQQLFGGLDRDIEQYVRKMTGEKTPAEILSDQATEAASLLKTESASHVSALQDLTRAYQAASSAFGAPSNDNAPTDPALLNLLKQGNGVAGAPGSLADMLSKGNGVSGPNDDGSADIVVTGKRPADPSLDKVLSAADTFNFAGERLISRLEPLLGVKLPVGLKKALGENLGTALQGVATGQFGGGLFSAITGGKNDSLASGIGGALGEKAGKSLEKPLTAVFGKTLGGFAGPLGGIIGGVLGNVLGGLFNNPKFGTAQVSLNQYGDAAGGAGTGNNGNATLAATGLAASVASGINALADQLGAKITNLAAVTVGDFDGKYRVASTNTTQALNYNNFDANTLKNFGEDQQAAIEYAVKYALSTSVINGISQASQNIIKSGQDLSVSIQKALLIEAVPKDLKAMLDPVGAAIDDLNRKWQKTVDALKEGGASAAQMAQAQQLYSLQLDQVKNSTDAADHSLKDFLTGLKVGGDSPYSLRDQETTARAQLQPFLDQINAGQSIDQSKYQDAAKSFLDVERQLYGSTQKNFDALDLIQSATNKAISTIDNAVPITPAVADPFGKATADSTAKVASGVQTGNEMTQDTNALLAQIATLMQKVADDTGGTSSDAFIGATRMFSKAS